MPKNKKRDEDTGSEEDQSQEEDTIERESGSEEESETKDEKEEEPEFNLEIKKEHVGDYKNYNSLSTRFDELQKTLTKDTMVDPLSLIDDNVTESLILAMNEALVYRPGNVSKFVSTTLKEFNNEVGLSGGNKGNKYEDSVEKSASESVDKKKKGKKSRKNTKKKSKAKPKKKSISEEEEEEEEEATVQEETNQESSSEGEQEEDGTDSEEY